MPTGIPEDLTGKNINSFTVLRRVKKEDSRRTFYLCRCVCGNEKVIRQDGIKKWGSCGCKQREKVKRTQEDRNWSSAKRAYDNYIKRDKVRGLDIGITLDVFYQLTQQPCYYCGSPPTNINKTYSGGIFIYNGLDRIDSSKGYIEENVVPCCYICNMVKLAMSREDFIDWIIRVYNYTILSKKGE